MKPGLTQSERVQIVDEAIRLIKRPDTFIQGDWKCPVFEMPKTNERFAVMTEGDEGGAIPAAQASIPPQAVQARDKDGRPLFAYCIEGAINQAGINILGPEKASRLGATNGVTRYGELEPAHSEDFADYLDINDLAVLMFAETFGIDPRSVEADGWRYEWDAEPPAQYINDQGGGLPDVRNLDAAGKHRRFLAHENVLSILRKRLTQLRKGK